MALIETADALIEGNRPGVMERLRLGPADCAKRNPRLVYGRMTGWGQDGPLAQAAGHDLNYLALSGVLSLSRASGARRSRRRRFSAMAGGALGLAFGAHERGLRRRAHRQGRVDRLRDRRRRGELWAASRSAARASGMLDAPSPSPFHDSPFYDVYRCADGRYVTVGALEPQFYALLLEKLGLADVDPKAQYDRAAWPALKARFRALFSSRPSAHWRALLEGGDACFAPVHEPCRGCGPSAQCGARRLCARPRRPTGRRRRAALLSARLRRAEANATIKGRNRTMLNRATPETIVFPLRRSAEARRSDRDSSGRLVGALPSPVPARSRQHLSDRGRRRAGAHRRWDRQRAVARRLGGASRRAASGAQTDAGHRHPLPPRPCGPGRMALRALRPQARDERDGISDRAQHPPRPARAADRSPTAGSIARTA